MIENPKVKSSHRGHREHREIQGTPQAGVWGLKFSVSSVTSVAKGFKV